MIFSRGVEPLLSQSGGLYKVFDTTLPILQSAHLSAGNFEGTLASANRKAEPKSYNFRFSPKVLPYLEKAGFDYLSITNNHIWDFGKEGFLDTLKAIESSHLATSGAGRNFKAAAVPWKTELEHQEISILSVGAYPQERNGFNGKDIAFAGNDKPGILFVDRGAREAIKEAFDDDAFHVLYVHGGGSGTENRTHIIGNSIVLCGPGSRPCCCKPSPRASGDGGLSRSSHRLQPGKFIFRGWKR